MKKEFLLMDVHILELSKAKAMIYIIFVLCNQVEGINSILWVFLQSNVQLRTSNAFIKSAVRFLTDLCSQISLTLI